MTLGYLSEIFILLVSPFIPLLIFDSSSSSANGLEAIIFFIPGLVAIYSYLVPLLLSVLYMIFGANFFLFSWLDNALVFLIEHYISNVQLVLLGSVLFSIWAIRAYVGLYHLTTMLLQSLITLYYWDRIMYKSVNAIRYLDPTWNKVSAGNRLWPSLAYILGVRSRESSTDSAEVSNAEDDSLSSDEVLNESLLTYF